MMNVYQPGPVMALMNPGSYTPEINDYLVAERMLLRTYLARFDTIVEAGCTDGRYRSEAAAAVRRMSG